ncbi:MAG: hypothetical protein LC799_15060, partial [Actinobacteria bacterium]|nr:hypothetical protein [Actinomycetota bacterium]
MPRKAGTSTKAQCDQLRARMRGYGCTVAQIAAEMSRRFGLRPRVAWRYALGWQQWKVAQEYNTAHPGSKLLDNRVSECENWPHGGSRPSLHYLANLAVTYGHGCTPAQLVDADDLDKLTPAERILLSSAPPPPTDVADPVAHPRGRRGAQRLVLPADQPPGELVIPTDPAVWAAVLGPARPGELVSLLMTCLG